MRWWRSLGVLRVVLDAVLGESDEVALGKVVEAVDSGSIADVCSGESRLNLALS
jgi:hypothetical protein